MRPSGLAWKPQDLFPMQSWGDAQQRATAVAIPPLLLLLFSTLPKKKKPLWKHICSQCPPTSLGFELRCYFPGGVWQWEFCRKVWEMAFIPSLRDTGDCSCMESSYTELRVWSRAASRQWRSFPARRGTNQGSQAELPEN